PDLVPLCAEVFDGALGDRPNQLDRRPEADVAVADLLDFTATPGAVTAAGLRGNVSVGIRYMASWLGGVGAAALHNLMEDAATAEISRAQIWQWIRNETVLDTGEPVTAQMVRDIADGLPGGGSGPARELFERVALAPEFVDFFTVPAYELID